MVGRVLLLIAAFFVAGLGALLVYLYASQADERALADLEPVSVYVVQEPLATGTDIVSAVAENQITLEDVPRSAVPQEAVSQETPLDGQVALTGLVQGEVLVTSRIGDPSAQESLPLPDDGRIAVSVSLEDPQRVADFVRPGSQVAVFLTWDVPQEAGDGDDAVAAPAAPGGDATSRNTRLLLDRAEVIAVGATTTQPAPAPEGDQATTEPVSRTILTLALTQAEAERLVLAQSIGQDGGGLYLALLGENSEIGPSNGADVDNLFSEAGE
jgi:pilus assembly protein CpaB